jgi:U3 small nucleolar RNA-associated protein 10
MSVAKPLAGNIMMSNEYKAHFESLVAKLHDDNPHIQILTHLVMHALIKQLSGEHQINAAHKILETVDYEQISAIQSLSEDASELLQVSLMISSPSHLECSLRVLMARN